MEECEKFERYGTKAKSHLIKKQHHLTSIKWIFGNGPENIIYESNGYKNKLK